ncbi:MAG: NADH dehydrogenase (quinone) subunit G [Desulfuromonas sp.]|uniref:NADH-quinone oxidoreductase subunit NuoG n=1 Tax=Desulfuromonas sp. TaxID=892 RepID=UPI000CAA84C8|nr:NADH-quinone oxidoreductase subunit NuoG [Desulfuromonas sp.]PLX86436.1 MAG: NADH dehydrogenase (quinone) subunit G [Desulfuromonas sp.]
MPTLTIDNRQITVPEGTNVLEAAKALGIVIPHFCYHEALGAVGACRLCAMKFVEGPVKGIQMACTVKAADEMVVSTLDPEAVELRAHVIEWLMTNHPHDCPVCDEGGECQLQDMTIAGGHSVRRFRGPKRTYRNQDLGPFVEQEMNRCIQCYRCVRTYQDYCGGDDFGVLGSRNRVFFGRFREGRLESPFSGNLVDACPTGVFTDKTYRFRSRFWDLEEAPSVCPHCSLGCATLPGARYRELQRVRSGVNREVNGFFLCDRGRFGYGHANHPKRPRIPKIDGRESSWEEALSETGKRLEAALASDGPGAVAFLGSRRASLEAGAALKGWAGELGSDRVASECHPGLDGAARTAAALLGDFACSLEEVRRSDLVVLVGADPLAEGPMMALAVRQAVREGGAVVVIDPRPVGLPCAAERISLPPHLLHPALEALASGTGAALPEEGGARVEDLAKRLRDSRHPALVGGAALLGGHGVAALARAASALSNEERPCGATILLPGPNSYGGALLAGDGPDFDTLLDGMLGGKIKALVCLESDPLLDHPDPGRVEAALARLDTLVVLDCLPTRTLHGADILLPTRAPAESDGTYVNNEGRMQTYARVFEPGIPISVSGGGDHPPRTFRPDTPGEQPLPAWAVLEMLRGRPAELTAVRSELVESDARFSGLEELEAGGTGQRVTGSGTLPPAGEPPLPGCTPGGTLQLLSVDAFAGSEPFSALSGPLVAIRPEPHLLISPADAERLDIEDGAPVRLTTERGHLALPARHAAPLPPGLLLLPRLLGTASEPFVPGGPPLDCTVEREGER